MCLENDFSTLFFVAFGLTQVFAEEQAAVATGRAHD